MKIQTITLLRGMLVIGGVLFLAAGNPARAQSSASANASVTIVPAIALTNNTALAFGLIVAGPGGTVTLTTSGSRTKTGTIILPSSESYSEAAFVVLGPAEETFSLSLPSSVTLGLAGGSATMTITNFTSNPSTGGSLNSGGSATVTVGGTLNVGANQTLGSYVGSFTVTVSYP